MLRCTRLVLPALLVLLAACSSAPLAPKPREYPDLAVDRVHLDRLWKVSVGKGLAGDDVRLTPAVGERRVLAASRDGVLEALDRETGKVLWRRKTGLPLTGGPAAGYGTVVVATAKGDVLAFAEDDGKPEWTVSVGAPVMAAAAINTDTVVVLAADGQVHALARDTGAQRWTYGTVVPPLSLHANAAPLISGDHVYVATSAGKLLSLEMASGGSEWETRVATNDGRSELERMTDIAGNLLLSGEHDLYSVGYQSQLTVTDAESGRRGWQFDVSSVCDLAEGFGNVYVTDTDGVVFAVDEASGKVVWKQTDYQYRRLTGPAVLGNLLAVGDDNGYVHLLAQSDGALRGREHPLRGALAALVSREGVLYVWAADGQLSAWKVSQPE